MTYTATISSVSGMENQIASAPAGEADAEQPKETRDDPAKDEILSKQKDLYARSIEALEDMLSKNRGLDGNNDYYQEEISSIYIFSEAYTGVLQAGFDGDGIHVFELAVADEDLGERQKFECRML